MARLMCQKCGKVLSNTSENKVEYFLINTWVGHYCENEYDKAIAESNVKNKQWIKDYPEDGEDIDTWFDVNMEFANDVWICPKCKTMHVFEVHSNSIKDIYWRIPNDEWVNEDTANLKHFYKWIDTKKDLHARGKTPSVKEGEVWWSGVGENVGIEINGKSSRFSRPVLIMRKLSREGFMGVPLTSQPKTGAWYVEIDFLNSKQYAAICQARVFSVNRLFDRMGTLPDSDLKKIKEGFQKLYK